MAGIVPGTLSSTRRGPLRARTLAMRPVNADRNEAGYAGNTTDSGVAGHGTSSPYDVHNTLIAAGPDFREHSTSAVPTANVDLAPTILRLLGLPVPETMTGRPIEEGFVRGPAVDSIPIGHSTESAKNSDGTYEVVAHISTGLGRRYLDYTEVKRSPR